MAEVSMQERSAANALEILARREEQRQESVVQLNIGGGIDADDYQYRRLTNGARTHTRDLTPLSHDRGLEISWYLFEQNAFAHRLITLMTDLIVGDGVQVEVQTDDRRIQAEIDKFFSRNQLAKQIRSFYIANSLNGELIFPVAVNPFSGTPVLGYVDSCQIKAVVPTPDNVLVLDELILKGTTAVAEQRIKIIRENPVSGKLEGDVFFHRINNLPNSMRGRPDLLPLADWLDLYDSFMFTEAERVNLLSAFVWDYTVQGGGTDAEIQAKVKKLPKIKPGIVFGHNEKETLEPRTPDLKASDRSEHGRTMRTHIAGSFGFPISYLGDTDSNRSTIEGQNDVMMKTPAARQKEFAGLLDQLVRYAIEQTTGKNPALFVGTNPAYRIVMPEIQAKDIARAGGIMASVASAMDTSIQNETASKKLGIRVMAAIIKQLGIEADPQDITNEIDAEAGEREEMRDMLQASLARANSRNPPVPTDPEPEPDDA